MSRYTYVQRRGEAPPPWSAGATMRRPTCAGACFCNIATCEGQSCHSARVGRSVDESCLRHNSDGLRIGFSSSQEAVPNEACGTVRPAYQNPHERVESVRWWFGVKSVSRRPHPYAPAFCQKAHCTSSPVVPHLRSASALDHCSCPLPPRRLPITLPTTRHPRPASVLQSTRATINNLSKLASRPPPPSDKTPPYAADSSRAVTHLLERRRRLERSVLYPPASFQLAY
jgi:hypothetical protein